MFGHARLMVIGVSSDLYNSQIKLQLGILCKQVEIIIGTRLIH